MEKGFKHFLLPTLSVEKDVEQVLKKLGLESAEKLPVILTTDASLQGLECAGGDVVRVANTNPVTSREELYYRRVVE